MSKKKENSLGNKLCTFLGFVLTIITYLYLIFFIYLSITDGDISSKETSTFDGLLAVIALVLAVLGGVYSQLIFGIPALVFNFLAVNTANKPVGLIRKFLYIASFPILITVIGSAIYLYIN